MRFHIPIRLQSLSNERLQWWNVAKIKKQHKTATKLCMRDLKLPPPPLVVLITRIGPRKLDDDNLQHACKHVRDQIAVEIAGGKTGQRDGASYFTWLYDQRIGDYGVDVEITSR